MLNILQNYTLWIRLLNAGLASTWVLSVLIISGVIAASVSGPCGLASILLASLSSFLAVLCYTEISKNNHTSIYETSREILGIRFAFLIGWINLIWRIVTLAACARGLGSTVDYMMNGLIKTDANLWLPTIFKNLYVDPLAGGAILFTALLFSLGLDKSRILRLFMNITIFTTILFFIIIGATHCDPEIWQSHDFLPAGINGLLNGAALCSAGLLGVISVQSENARIWSKLDIGQRGRILSSRKMVLSSSIITISITTTASLAITIVLTLMVHFKALSSEAPTLVQAFEIRDVDWARLVMATLGITSLSLSLVEIASPIHKLIRTLAADGFLPLIFAKNSTFTGTPVMAISTCGIITTILAVFTPVTLLLQIAAATAILINSIFTATATILRFQQNIQYTDEQQQQQTAGPSQQSSVNGLRAKLEAIPAAVKRAGEACRWGNDIIYNSEERSPLVLTNNQSISSAVSSIHESEYDTDSSDDNTDIDAAVAEFKEKIKVATLSEFAAYSIIPDAVTARRATLSLIVSFIIGTIGCITLLTMLDNEKPNNLLILITTSCFFISFLFTGIASRQPQIKKQDVMRVPFAPWLPSFATLLHTTLFIQILINVWEALLLAAIPGILIFILYEWKNSKRRILLLRRRTRAGERIHLNSHPPTAIIPTLIPSHQNLPLHSQRRLTRVDTILISR